jgi:orotidine-5'-phosphate decarboxylase
VTSSISRVLSAPSATARLCVGLDPHPGTLIEWGGRDDVESLRGFCDVLIEALLESKVAVCKPQVALFERHGLAGLSVLAKVVAIARENNIAVIADVKRGDIGSSVRGYAEAWLLPGGDFESDAMTAVAYQGVGSLDPVMDIAREHDKAVFVLAATSNPEGWRIQAAAVSTDDTVAATVCEEVETIARTSQAGVFGVVVGATVNHREVGLHLERYGNLSILAPGFGAQGADLGQLGELFPGVSSRVIPAVSRSVYSAGPGFVVESIAAHQEALGG